MSLHSFEDYLREQCTELLWAHWTALGVRGSVASVPRTVVDPESLVALTWSIGRVDPRLFDSALAWLRAQSSFLDMTRLQRIIDHAPRQVKSLAAACSAKLSHGNSGDWERLVDESYSLTEPQNVFVSDDVFTTPDQHFARFGWLRGQVSLQEGAIARPDLSDGVAARLVLRKLTGTNARAEVLTGVFFGQRFFTRDIANVAEYSARSVQLLLREFEDAGLVKLLQEPGRPTQGWPSPKAMAVRDSLFSHRHEAVGWIDMSALSLALIDIWQTLQKIRERQLDDYPAETLFRDAFLSAVERLHGKRGPEIPIFDSGQKQLAELLDDARQLVDAIIGGLVE